MTTTQVLTLANTRQVEAAQKRAALTTTQGYTALRSALFSAAKAEKEASLLRLYAEQRAARLSR